MSEAGLGKPSATVGRGDWGPLAAGFFALLLYGLVEWWIVGRGGLGLFQGEALRSLAALILLYGGVGAAAGLLAAAAQFGGAAPASGWALPIAVVMALAALRDSQGRFAVLGAGALFAAVAVLGTRHGSIVDAVGRRIVPSAVAIGLGILVAASSLGMRDSASAWALVAAVFVAGLGVVAASSPPRKRAVLCSASVLLALCVSGALGIRPPVVAPDATPSNQPAVLLVTIDTLRADRVGAYGHSLARTPNFDALARDGVLFETVIAPTVWTGPSHTSIFTGLVPERHGVLHNANRLDPSVETIVESLREAGFVTGSFNGGFTTTESALGLPGRFHFFDDDMRMFRWLPPIASELTLVRGAETVLAKLGVQIGRTWGLYRPAGSIVDAARRWLVPNGDRPWFVWVHFFDPHLPYQPPPELVPEPGRGAEDVSGLFYRLSAEDQMRLIRSPAATARMLELYDAEIAYVDRELGRLLAAAREAAPTAGLVTVVTSDHGESMGEHGLYWNRDLHDESLRVPLVFTGPGIAPATNRVSDQVRLIDIAPTILQLLDLDVPADLDGTTLSPWLFGQDPPPPVPAISVIYRQPMDFHRSSVAIRSEEWKLIELSEGWLGGALGPSVTLSRSLYDLVRDPRELDNVAASNPDAVNELSRLLANRIRLDDVSMDAITPEQERMLRSLGYIR